MLINKTTYIIFKGLKFYHSVVRISIILWLLFKSYGAEFAFKLWLQSRVLKAATLTMTQLSARHAQWAITSPLMQWMCASRVLRATLPHNLLPMAWKMTHAKVSTIGKAN